MMSIPVTERSNELTELLDEASPPGIVRLLRGTDAQLFAGYRAFHGLYDPSLLERLEAAVDATARTLATPTGVVIMTGKGHTSFVSRLHTACIQYPALPTMLVHDCGAHSSSLPLSPRSLSLRSLALLRPPYSVLTRSACRLRHQRAARVPRGAQLEPPTR